MRLYNIFYICKLYYPGLTDVGVKNGKIDGTFEIINWLECKKSLEVFMEIDCLTEYAKETYNSLLPFEREKNIPLISANTKQIFFAANAKISYAVKTLIDLCDSLEMGEAQSGIDIKIPKCESLDEYMGYLKEINFILTQCPYLLCKDETVRFNTVDVGSQWLSFIVEVSATAAVAFYILNNLARLVERAVAIKSNILFLKQQEEMLETMRQKNEVAEDVIDTFKKLKQITMDECLDGLENDIGKTKDGEERTKVEKTIEKLVFLIDKGVEIYSSIETPNEIKALFPFEKDTALLPNDLLKLIEDKAADSE